MKHCRNCEYCRMDMVAQYVMGLDLYKCDKTNLVINEPFWEGRKCEAYKKNSFGVGSVHEWFNDRVYNYQ